jgi:hypothetical protein
MNKRSLLDVVLNSTDRLIADFKFVQIRNLLKIVCLPENAFVDPDPFDQNKCVFLSKFACIITGSGSGSGIRDGKKSGSSIRDEHPRSFF